MEQIKIEGLNFLVKSGFGKTAFYYLCDDNGLDMRNKKGEKIMVEVCWCVAMGKNDLPHKWHKSGMTKELLSEWWSINTEVTNNKNVSYRGYNPQVKFDETRKRNVINFDWMLPATDENLKALLLEVGRRFMGENNEN